MKTKLVPYGKNYNEAVRALGQEWLHYKKVYSLATAPTLLRIYLEKNPENVTRIEKIQKRNFNTIKESVSRLKKIVREFPGRSERIIAIILQIHAREPHEGCQMSDLSVVILRCTDILFTTKDRDLAAKRLERLEESGFDSKDLANLESAYKEDFHAIGAAIDFGIAKIDADSEEIREDKDLDNYIETR